MKEELFEKNTAQVNRLIARILAICSLAIIIMVGLSLMKFFEFGSVYTFIVLFGGLVVTLSPSLLIGHISDNVYAYPDGGICERRRLQQQRGNIHNLRPCSHNKLSVL